jgi:hypothetical protein
MSDLFDPGDPEKEGAAPGQGNGSSFGTKHVEGRHSTPHSHNPQSTYRRRPLTAQLVRLSLEAWRP